MEHNFGPLICLIFFFQLLLSFSGEFSIHRDKTPFRFDSIDNNISLTRTASTILTGRIGLINWIRIYVSKWLDMRKSVATRNRTLSLFTTSASTKEKPKRIIVSI